MDIFLSGLERRLDWLENYGNLKIDAGIDRAYSTLEAVREACSTVSGELMDAGRRRAKLIVDILDTRYNEALATKETLEAKAQASVRLMEDFLVDMEARAQAVRDAGLAGVVDEGWRRAEDTLKSAKGAVDEGLERARLAKASLKHSIEMAVQRAQEHGLIRYEDLPIPWRINPHIVRGYRFSENKIDCVWSAFKVSNETVNIWSHAIGLIVVLSIAFYFYPTSAHWPLSSNTDIFFAAMFFFAACKCLVCSTLWHTMNSIADQTLMERFACVDYTGISLLIAASIMTTEHAGTRLSLVPSIFHNSLTSHATIAMSLMSLSFLLRADKSLDICIDDGCSRRRSMYHSFLCRRAWHVPGWTASTGRSSRTKTDSP